MSRYNDYNNITITYNNISKQLAIIRRNENLNLNVHIKRFPFQFLYISNIVVFDLKFFCNHNILDFMVYIVYYRYTLILRQCYTLILSLITICIIINNIIYSTVQDNV